MNDHKGRKLRASKISKKLKEIFPGAKIALNFSNDWELLVAVILFIAYKKIIIPFAERMLEFSREEEEFEKSSRRHRIIQSD